MIRLNLLLNSGFSGANAFFALAESEGMFRAAGFDLRFTPGRGAWTAASRLADGEFDLAYGDIHALVQLAANGDGDDLPKAFCAVHQHAPSVISVASDGPVRSAADLNGKSIIGHPSDVALQTFALYASSCELDPATITVHTSELGMADLLQGMLAGQCEAVFGYTTTHTAALSSVGLESTSVRFLPYRQACPDLYGSVWMVSARLVRDHPQWLADLTGVLRQAVAEAQRRPITALQAVLALAPTANLEIEATRWRATMIEDMGLNDPPDASWGQVDGPRLEKSIQSLCAAKGWRTIPALHRIVTPAMLQPLTPSPSTR